MLEQGRGAHADAFERVFGTAHGVDLAAWCGATQTPHTRAPSVKEAVAAALDPRGGLHVVELRTDRAVLPDLHRRLRAAVSTAVTATPR